MKPDTYKVIVKNGIQYLTYKGEILPDQIKSTVIQDMEHVLQGRYICTVKIEVRAMLEDTKEIKLKS